MSDQLGFEVFVSTMPGFVDAGIVIAAARAGATGVLDLELIASPAEARAAFDRVARFTSYPIAVRLRAGSPVSDAILHELPACVETVIISLGLENTFPERARNARRLLAEVTSLEQAQIGLAGGARGLIAKGQEAGGLTGDETAFILLQRLAASFEAPIFVRGGIGPNSAAACRAGGASGVLIDEQVLLARESALPPDRRAIVERCAGDDTIALGAELGLSFRCLHRHDSALEQRIERLAREHASSPHRESARARWLAAVLGNVGWLGTEERILPLGQAASFARPLAGRFGTVAGIVGEIRRAAFANPGAIRTSCPLAAASPLARSHGTRYPILQGPMTRVSDTPAFAQAIADGGALPFLALAQMRGGAVAELLERTRGLLGARPWGVGILGFLSPEQQAEQLEAVERHAPPFALIAGARPSQALALERRGTRAYAHVPSADLLSMFLTEGVRRFVFEGRECGGHVGPRTSLVLGETMVSAILDRIDELDRPEELHLVFAGGIHDARSAAMIAALAAPLVAHGVKIGVLLGTAYLFTREAVETGAILDGFQREAIECTRTVLLETGLGHTTRCADTPFVAQFRDARRRLLEEERPAAELRDELERLNLGRLRLAAKGLRRTGTETLQPVGADEQRAEGMYMIGQLAALRATRTTIAELHEEVSSGAGARIAALENGASITATIASPETAPPPCDVAIVGMQCLMPGAIGLDALWSNILRGVDAITEVPKERFDVDRYFDAAGPAPDKTRSRWGGFLRAVDIDPLRFGIPPAALPAIDPLQLLSLLVAGAALADAGYATRAFDRARASIVLGLGGGLGDLGFEYALRAQLPEILEHVPHQLLERLRPWTEDVFPGVLLNVAAGRIANRLDLGGVNFTVDAACASSLAAVYAAANELTLGTSDLVIAGGVETLQSPFGYLCFSTVNALSPHGRCRTFDAGADGIVISEGVGMIVLKRLADAERDGDRIYAVLKGIAGSSDGRGRSLVAPLAKGQMRVLERAYAQAAFAPASVGLIEAHGTGTVAGDEAELSALGEVFGSGPNRRAAIGSVKSMIGHTKAAAGIAGLIKTALAIYHRVIPPTLHVDQPNPKLRDPTTAFYVTSTPRPWIAGRGTPRRAGVSAFGFGGTNFHAVLEEHRGDFSLPEDRPGAIEWPLELTLWSARSAAELHQTIAAVEAEIERDPRVELRAIALAAASRAERSPSAVHRLAIVASSSAELAEKLRRARGLLNGTTPKHLDDGLLLDCATRAKTAVLFPGQGSQRPQMLRELTVYFPEVREHLERADAILARDLPRPLSAYVHPPPPLDRAEAENQEAELTDTRVAQPALGAVEMGLYRLLERLGLEPNMCGGHSYGEYVALWAAGSIDGEDLLSLSALRGKVVHEVPGEMLAVRAPPAAIEPLLRGIEDVHTANLNSPTQTVLAGTSVAVNLARATLEAAGLQATRVPVRCPFHSPLLAPARDQLLRALRERRFAPPRLAVYANASAERYPDRVGGILELLQDHLVRPVRFFEELRAMYRDGARTFLEVGPGRVLTSFVRRTFEADPAVTAICLAEPNEGLDGFLRALAELWIGGAALDPLQLFRGRAASAHRWCSERPGWRVSGGHVFHSASPPAPRARVQLEPAAMTAPSSRDVEAAMTRYQALMSEFLATQAEVMRAYLGGTPARGKAFEVNPLEMKPVEVKPLEVKRLDAAPVLPPPEPPSPKLIAVRDQLLELVSGRTGYPRHVLKLSAGIESDLGIDSIKRLEILASLQSARPRAERPRLQKMMEQLIRARTLGEIIELVEQASAQREPLPRFCFSAASAPPRGPARTHRGRIVVLTDEGRGFARGLAERLRAAGEVPALLPRDPDPHFRADFPGAPAALIHTLALEHPPAERALERFHLLARELLPGIRALGRSGGAAIIVVTARGGTCGLDAGAPVDQALADLIRSLAAEEPDVSCRVVDLPDLDPRPDLLDALFVELASEGQGLEVGLAGTDRITPRATPAPLATRARRTLDEGAVILATGGASGITGEISKRLAEKYRARMILIGSTPEPDAPEPPALAGLDDRRLRAALADRLGEAASPASIEREYHYVVRRREIRACLEAIRRAGASGEYHAIDIRDAASFRALIEQLRARHGRIDGVIHGAGVIEDRRLVDKTPESFARVLSTKIEPARVLVDALRWDELRFCFFMSSVTARFGNAGQTDYAAANGFLDGLARQLARRHGARVRSLCWGPWSGVGMAEESVLRLLESRGISAIEPAEGVEALIDELELGADDQPVIVLGRGPWCRPEAPRASEQAARADA